MPTLEMMPHSKNASYKEKYLRAKRDLELLSTSSRDFPNYDNLASASLSLDAKLSRMWVAANSLEKEMTLHVPGAETDSQDTKVEYITRVLYAISEELAETREQLIKAVDMLKREKSERDSLRRWAASIKGNISRWVSPRRESNRSEADKEEPGFVSLIGELRRAANESEAIDLNSVAEIDPRAGDHRRLLSEPDIDYGRSSMFTDE